MQFFLFLCIHKWRKRQPKPQFKRNSFLYIISASCVPFFNSQERAEHFISPKSHIYFSNLTLLFYKISLDSKFLCCDKPFGVRVTNFVSKTEYYSSKYLTLQPLRSFIFLNYWALFLSWSRLYKFYEGPTLMACTCIK